MLAGLLGPPAAARAQHAPAPDPPLFVRPDALPRSPAEAPRTDGIGLLPEPTTEWTLHRTADGLHPDGDEQAMVWLMNRARQNPAAEGVRLATSTDADVASGRTFFMVNLAILQSEFAALAPKPPAAFDARLYQASQAHSLDLIARDAQDHNGQIDRITAAGFQFSRVRASVFSFAESSLNAHAALNIDWGSGDGTGMQPGRGHRAAIMSSDGDYTNVGIALVPEANPGTTVGPLVMSGGYAAALTNGVDLFNRFLVGTVWRDLNGNGQYDHGEGLAGVTVTPDQGSFFALTSAGGGYAIPMLAPGSFEVTFSGGPVGGGARFPVTVGADSVLLDYVVGATAGTDRSTVTAPASGTVVPLSAGTVLRLSWTAVGGLTAYEIEYTGPGFTFTNPNAAGPDAVHGLGGAGGALRVTGTSVDVALNPAVPPGSYQVRVIGLSPGGARIGTFSNAVTLFLGVAPDTRPSIVVPAGPGTASRGGPVTVSWTGVPGVTRYALEVVGPNRSFAVPNADTFDPAAGAPIVVSGTTLTAVVPAAFPPGSYQVRVFGLTATGQPLGRASDAVTITIN